MGDALWLPDYLTVWCPRVRFVPGWETRGKPGLNPRGVVGHHIGIGGTANAPGLGVVTHGRPGLVNALCNVHQARDGIPTVVAARVAWHAGAGGYAGLAGNASVLGIEAEGTTAQPMSDVQHEGYELIVAALLDGLGREEGWACAHHEWRAEKPDPWALLNGPGGMDGFRARVGDRLRGLLAPAPPPDPPEEDDDVAKIMEFADWPQKQWLVEIFPRVPSPAAANPYRPDGVCGTRWYIPSPSIYDALMAQGVKRVEGVVGGGWLYEEIRSPAPA